jgi:Acetyltransferase (GNAT) domain
MKEPVCVRELEEADHERWNDLVAASPEGSPYSTPEYLAALCEATGAGFRILAAHRGGELLGGVALYEERTRLGLAVSPRLLLYYNGFVLRHYETKYPSVRSARQLETMAALREALSRSGYSMLKLQCRSPLVDARVFLEAGWTARPSYTYVVPIDDLERLRDRVEQNLRRLIERCTRQGIVAAEDDDFASFFRMHVETHERKGSPVYLPQAAFERYFRRLRAAGLARLYHARLPDGRAICTQLVLAGRHRVGHTMSAAAEAQHLGLGATAFLRYKVFEDLSKRGYLALDLTDAALNPVSHFKSQLGGDLELGLTLEAPPSPRVRLWRLGRTAYRGVRQALRALRPAPGVR